VDYAVDFAEWSQGIPVASRVVAGSGGGGPLVGASALISG
jgi:hypothetical protein